MASEAAQRERNTDEEEVDYESDNEAAGSLALALRRRRASDDEEDEDDAVAERRRISGYADDESEGEGAPPPLEDEEEDDEEEEFEDDVIIVEEEEEVVEEEAVEILRRGPLSPVVDEAQHGVGGKVDGDEGTAATEQSVEEKKEVEPFAVPTAGAFYMHDDRFRDNGGVRPRRSAGGRKLWEAKDDRAWVHDRFEELNLQDDDEKYRRGGRGQFRGRGRGRGGRRGQGRGNRSRMYEDSNALPFVRQGGGRGRGSRRKEADVRNGGDSSMLQGKHASKPSDTLPDNSSSRPSSQPANVHADGMNTKKNIGSSLSSASPPFYPSGTQHQRVLIPFKRDSHYGGSMRSTSGSVVTGDDEMRASSSANISRNGKNIVTVRGQSQPQADPTSRSSAGKQTNNVQQTSKSTSVNFPQQQQSKVQGRNQAIGGQSTGLPVNSGQQINKGANFTKMDPTVPPRSLQNQGQTSSRTVSQQSLKQTIDGNQSSSGTSTSEVGNALPQPASNKGKHAAIGRAGGNPQGSGRASYGYNGTQAVPGTSGMSVSHSEQSFPHAPTLLPVMQFGGQHHGGLGVPAVGMALPGYVAQPQLGFGATEMTWVPFLAGAAGALGATYCSPYLAVDGSYYPQTAAQPTSFGVAGRDADANKNQNMWKSNTRSELLNDEFGQRQNKPRRYSERNFGQ